LHAFAAARSQLNFNAISIQFEEVFEYKTMPL
jgi:hypothetical protein